MKARAGLRARIRDGDRSPRSLCAGVRLGLLAALLWPLPGAVAGQPAAPDAGALTRQLNQVLDGRRLKGASLSALVVDRASGEVLYARHPERALVPASNQKLLTSAAALARLGPTYRFPTEVRADRVPDAQGRVGELMIRAGGDPTMTSEQWWRLAADLRAQGLSEVTSGLLIDDRIFDDERWHGSWQPVTARAYHAPVGAMNANYGAFRVHVAPGAAAGAPGRVRIDPPVPYLEVVNQVRTRSAKRPASLRVDRIAVGETERVVVSGGLALDAAGRNIYRSVAHPSRYAAAVLRLQLEANGIRVGPATRRGPVSDEAPVLLQFEGHPLAQVVALFMKNSNNMIGESLVKTLARVGPDAPRPDEPEDDPFGGEPGTWRRGTATMQKILRGLGLDLADLRVADGSGLSRDNRVSARLLVDLLRLGDRSFGFGPEWMASLPIAGRDGTLRRRARGAQDRVRAKTGLLTGVTGLSGRAEGRSGREIVFSVIANGYRQGDRAAMDALDEFATVLVDQL